MLTTTSDVATGTFTPAATLSKNDMWNVVPIDNRDDQIGEVVYLMDYDADSRSYRTSLPFIDADSANLADIQGPRTYTISSKGLISASTTAAPWCVSLTTACTPAQVRPSSAFGADAGTWAKLYASMLLDRYKQPPMKFKARLKWQYNTLEVGDVVKVGYDISNVFSDFELNTTTLTNRLFEIVELHPNFEGSLDATFLGHRYVSY